MSNKVIVHEDGHVDPAPGSREALELGCRCAVLDNARGRGMLIDGRVHYWITASCPLHGGIDLGDTDE